MYRLLVYYRDESLPRQAAQAPSARDVQGVMERLLAAHGGCQRLEVFVDDLRLFVVDRDGRSLP